MKEIAKHKNITGREEGFIPAPPVTIHSYCRQGQSGDKSLFPAGDFLRLNMEFDFALSENGQPPAAQLHWEYCRCRKGLVPSQLVSHQHPHEFKTLPQAD